jgi:chromosome partitioning protein
MARTATASVAKKPRKVLKSTLPDELISPAERAEVQAAIASGRRPVIAIAQRKGGSGKTTCSRTISELAALPEGYGLSTLAIDFDSQCSLSKLYLRMETPDDRDGMTQPPIHPEFNAAEEGNEWNGRSSSADIFYANGAVAAYPVTRIEGVGRLDLLPADVAKLTEVEEHDRTYLAERVQNRLRDWVGQPDVRAEYPIIVIDTAPSDHPLTRAALRAATHLLIPVTMEQQGIDGLHEMLSLWRQENSRRTENDMLQIIAIQPNLVMPGSLHAGFYQSLQSNPAFAPYLSPLVIKRRTAIAERDVRGLKPNSIFHMAASEEPRKMMLDFGRFVLRRAFLNEGPDVRPGRGR